MSEKLYSATSEGQVEIPEEEADAIRAEWAKNDAKREATKYSRDRQSAYPDWREQLDQIYHEGIDAWKVSIKKIKDDNPKP
jgi:hypothetical protein